MLSLPLPYPLTSTRLLNVRLATIVYTIAPASPQINATEDSEGTETGLPRQTQVQPAIHPHQTCPPKPQPAPSVQGDQPSQLAIVRVKTHSSSALTSSPASLFPKSNKRFDVSLRYSETNVRLSASHTETLFLFHPCVEGETQPKLPYLRTR